MNTMDQIFYWIGVGTCAVAALYGLSEGGLWLSGRLLKSLGIWPDFCRVLNRAYRERVERAQPPGR